MVNSSFAFVNIRDSTINTEAKKVSLTFETAVTVDCTFSKRDKLLDKSA